MTLFVRLRPELTRPKYVDPAFRIPSPFELAPLPTATRFDLPLGSENGAMAYNAQRFTENHHLDDDLNGIGGEDSDLSDPIYAVAERLEILPMRQQVNPIEREQCNRQITRNTFFPRGEIRQPQARNACYENNESVEIKDRQPAESGKDERIPLQSGEKTSVKKLNR
jgi:hypothetical protein